MITFRQIIKSQKPFYSTFHQFHKLTHNKTDQKIINFPVHTYLTLTDEEDSAVARKWDYCSDHLPVFGNILGLLRLGSWNILNSAYLSHVVRDPWKKGYFMNQEKKPSTLYPDLSQREEECYLTIKLLLLDGSSSLDVLCIQECSSKMFNLLKKEFSNSKEKVGLFMTDGGMHNHVVTLVKFSPSLKVVSSFSRVLWQREYVPENTKTPENPKGTPLFGPDEWRPAQCVTLELLTPYGKTERVNLVNMHISCAGKSRDYKIARANEVAKGIQDLEAFNETLVLTGDFNMTSEEMNETELKKHVNLSKEYSHIDTYLPMACAIDPISIRASLDKTRRCAPICRSEVSVKQAALVYNNALNPLILSRRGLVS